MSKISCKCGNFIVDQTDDLIFKATFIRDQNVGEIFNRVSDIAEFINSIKNHSRNEWLEKYFKNNMYNDCLDSEILNDILLRYENKYESLIYNCQQCGRIMIEKDKENNFIFFNPEENNWKDIFKKLSE